MTPLEDPSNTPTLGASDRDFLWRTICSLLAYLPGDESPARRLQGDPHEGNRIAVNGDVVWVDLEAVCIGPLEWDLSALDEEDATLFGEADSELLALCATFAAAAWPPCAGCSPVAHRPSMRRPYGTSIA